MAESSEEPHNNVISGPYASILGGAETLPRRTQAPSTVAASNRTTTEYCHRRRRLLKPRGHGHRHRQHQLHNTADTGYYASILGGVGNQASAENSAVSGGYKNQATGEDSSVTGGKENKATTAYSLAPSSEGLSVLSKAEQESLKSILPYFRLDGDGVGGKPTLQIEGANLQVMSSGIPQRSGDEGTGNLVVGQ